MSVGEETIYMKIKAGKFKAGCWDGTISTTTTYTTYTRKKKKSEKPFVMQFFSSSFFCWFNDVLFAIKHKNPLNFRCLLKVCSLQSIILVCYM